MNFIYDVLIVGGGPGGMTSALTLGRGRRHVLLCDDDRPRNAPAKLMQNFPSRDGIAPAEYSKLVRKDLEKYPTVRLVKENVTSVKKSDEGFLAVLKSGTQVRSRKLIIAVGVKDELPPIPGIANLWGKSIFHCPYCHGFEHQDQPLGLLVNEEKIFQAIPLLLGISRDLILFTNAEMPLSAAQKDLLKKNQVTCFEEKIISFKAVDGHQLSAVELADGSVIPRSAFFLRPPMRPKSDIGEQLGCRITDLGLYEVDATGRSTEKGVFVAGDLNDIRQSVLIASASGATTAIAVNLELLTEDFQKGL